MRKMGCTLILFCLVFCCFSSQLAAQKPISQEIELGKSFARAGDYQKAAETFNRILTERRNEIVEHPLHADTWYFFSVTLRRLGRANLADRALQRAKAIRNHAQQASDEPETTTIEEDLDHQLGVEAAQEPGKQIDDTAVQADPSQQSLASIKNTEAAELYRKAATLQRKNQLQGSANHYLEALKLEPENADLLEQAALLFSTVGATYYSDAQAAFDKLQKIDSSRMSVNLLIAQARANIYSAKPDLDKAQQILEKLQKDHSDNLQILVLAGTLDHERSNYPEAIKKFTKVIELDSELMAAYIGLGLSLHKQQNYAQAIDILQSAHNKWPNEIIPLIKIGNIHLEQNDLSQAWRSFTKAHNINPNNFDANLALAEINVHRVQIAAGRYLDKCEEIFKGHPAVDYWRAMFKETWSGPISALSDYTLIAMYQDEYAYKAKLRLGQIFSGRGHETFPGNVLIERRPRFRETYAQLVEPELAYNYFLEYLDKYPDSPQAELPNQWIRANEHAVREAKLLNESISSMLHD